MSDLSRRSVVRAGAALAAGAFIPVAPLDVPAAVAAGFDVPPGLPFGIVPYVAAFKNWSGETVTDPLWTVSVVSAQQCVDLANWAAQRGWKLRPRGYMHNWSPLAIDGTETWDSTVLMVDVRTLIGVTVSSAGSGLPARASAMAGTSMDALLARLEWAGLALTNHPAPGDLTVAGALAIGGHGTSIPADGERTPAGGSFGSLASLVIDLDAVVWDAATSTYVLRRFTRSDPDCAALLVHLGRAFITRITLAAGPRHRLRCRSYVTIPGRELLAEPGSGGRTVDSFLKSSGRMEVIWFPFTDTPWFKVWSPSGSLLPPFGSRWTLTPYNYSFSDTIPKPVTDLIAAIQHGDVGKTPSFGQLQLSITKAGLVSTLTSDLWGWSKDLLLYVRPTTLRMHADGYAILCRRADVQAVMAKLGTMWLDTLQRYAARGEYPLNGPLEIRVTGLDRAADSGVAGAQDAALSAVRPRPDRPDLDCAVWFDILTLPGTPGMNSCYAEIEQWLYDTFGGDGIRAEWSKGWAYTASAPWANDTVATGRVPEQLDAGQPAGSRFADAAATLRRLDAKGIYGSALTTRLLG